MNVEELQRRLNDAEQRLQLLLKQRKFTEYEGAFEQVSLAQRTLAAAKEEEYANPLDIGFLPEAAVSGPLLIQTDSQCFLTFNAVRMLPNGKREAAGTGVVEIRGCSITKFGYPNDEALSGHPLYKRGLVGYGVFEVPNSIWIKQMTEQNRVAFPNPPDSTQRHFIFSFHDSTFECVADELVATLSHENYQQLFERLTREELRFDHE
jgi:hypothetical protein